MLSAHNLLATFPSNHNIIDVEINFQSIKPPTLNSFTYRDFKSIKPEALLHLLASCDWSSMSCPNSGIDARLEHLSQNIMYALDQLTPLKEFKPQKKSVPPWVDGNLKELYNRRDAVRRRYKRTRDNALRVESQSLATEAKQRTEKAREQFLQNRLFDALENNKDIWGELRRLGIIKKANEQLHGFTPDELNMHFAGVSVSPTEPEADLDEILSEASDSGFTFREVTFSDVVLAVAHFSS